jgi:Fur family peroxide stress response transcriptional regulator
VEGQGGPRRFDPNMESHHHFHCMDCGKIIDFYSKDYDDLRIPEDIEEKFTVLGKRVVLKGICNNCGRKK